MIDSIAQKNNQLLRALASSLKYINFLFIIVYFSLNLPPDSLHHLLYYGAVASSFLLQHQSVTLIDCMDLPAGHRQDASPG